MPSTLSPSSARPLIASAQPPVVLSAAGSDCSAGAGVQADLKTFTALGCYGMTALTSVVAETSVFVKSIQLLDGAIVEDQITVLLEGFPVSAAKTGMLGGREQIKAAVKAFRAYKTSMPMVVDPVMIATSGASLLEPDAVEVMTNELFPLATVLTPNLDEAAALLGHKISSREGMEDSAAKLAERYGCAILLKGGHLEGSHVPDILHENGQVDWLEGNRIEGVNTHGTGCTYSAAITAGLAHRLSLLDAVKQAKRFVTQAIAQHHHWSDLQALNQSVRLVD